MPNRKDNIYCSKSCKTGAYLKKNSNKAKQFDEANRNLQMVREQLEQIVMDNEQYRTNSYLQEIFMWCKMNIANGVLMGLDYLTTYTKMEKEYLSYLEKYNQVKAYIIWRDKYSEYYPAYKPNNLSLSAKQELREWDKNNLSL